MMDKTNIVRLNAIADFYQLLAVLFRLPHEKMVEGLIDGTITRGIREIIEEIGFSEKQTQLIEQALEDIEHQAETGLITGAILRQAYTRAFTHPGKPLIFPYESQFLFWEANPDSTYDLAPRLFVSDAALDTERCYKKAGLKNSQEHNEPGDYLPVELEFLGRLYAHLAEVLSGTSESGEDPEQVYDLIREFDYYHLKKWGVSFFDKCAILDFNSTYKSLAALASVFIGEMLSQTDGWMPRKKESD